MARPSTTIQVLTLLFVVSTGVCVSIGYINIQYAETTNSDFQIGQFSTAIEEWQWRNRGRFIGFTFQLEQDNTTYNTFTDDQEEEIINWPIPDGFEEYNPYFYFLDSQPGTLETVNTFNPLEKQNIRVRLVNETDTDDVFSEASVQVNMLRQRIDERPLVSESECETKQGFWDSEREPAACIRYYAIETVCVKFFTVTRTFAPCGATVYHNFDNSYEPVNGVEGALSFPSQVSAEQSYKQVASDTVLGTAPDGPFNPQFTKFYIRSSEDPIIALARASEGEFAFGRSGTEALATGQAFIIAGVICGLFMVFFLSNFISTLCSEYEDEDAADFGKSLVQSNIKGKYKALEHIVPPAKGYLALHPGDVVFVLTKVDGRVVRAQMVDEPSRKGLVEFDLLEALTPDEEELMAQGRDLQMTINADYAKASKPAALAQEDEDEGKPSNIMNTLTSDDGGNAFSKSKSELSLNSSVKKKKKKKRSSKSSKGSRGSKKKTLDDAFKHEAMSAENQFDDALFNEEQGAGVPNASEQFQ